jgi:alkanesulfonate monooxygenase SsuD/methylene tetrahydromethanopterin reductase-like flavin-dependent oxidoreductase (luciferase family)
LRRIAATISHSSGCRVTWGAVTAVSPPAFCRTGTSPPPETPEP